MKKKEIKALKKLVAEWRKSTAMPYASNAEFEEGVDMGREHAADELEYLLKTLEKDKV